MCIYIYIPVYIFTIVNTHKSRPIVGKTKEKELIITYAILTLNQADIIRKSASRKWKTKTLSTFPELTQSHSISNICVSLLYVLTIFLLVHIHVWSKNNKTITIPKFVALRSQTQSAHMHHFS